MQRQQLSRRQFAGSALAFGGLHLFAQGRGGAGTGARLPPWTAGELDIHHIDTGRGNATFLLGPDGTTLLIDCGTNADGPEVSAPARPDGTRTPGEWVARYALRVAAAAHRSTLDYSLATHIHPDHVGDLPAGAPAPAGGGFVPTGLSEVDGLMPATVVIDRSYPEYGQLPPADVPFARNYLAWLTARRRKGQVVQRAAVGSATQIALQTPQRFPSFGVRMLAANGRVWTGQGEASRSVFPDLASLPADQLPNENKCSIALRLQYGDFRYYTGGDLSADTRDGRLPWQDVESAAVEACGRVEVAVADHHAYFDACGPAFTRALDAQAYILPAWHLTHPDPAPLERLLGAWPGVPHRDVFSTEMLPANRLFNARWLRQMRSTQGHIVVRVAPGGGSYRIFVLDSTVEDGTVVASCGPYQSRPA